MKVEIRSTSVRDYRCSGYLCDRKRVIENIRNKRTCGCYSMNHRMSNVVLVHELKVMDKVGILMSMENFSSFRFKLGKFL